MLSVSVISFQAKVVKSITSNLTYERIKILNLFEKEAFKIYGFTVSGARTGVFENIK